MKKKRVLRAICLILLFAFLLSVLPENIHMARAEEPLAEGDEESNDAASAEDIPPSPEEEAEQPPIPEAPAEQMPEQAPPPAETSAPATVVTIIEEPTDSGASVVDASQPQTPQPEAEAGSDAQPSITVTKHPVSVAVTEGSTIRLEAAATGYSTAKWYFKDPNGQRMFSASNMFDGIEGLSLQASSAEGKEILTINNAPAELNGWSVQCAFFADGQTTVYTTSAVFTVATAEPAAGGGTETSAQDPASTGEDKGFVQSKKVNGVTVTVKATEGTFPDDAVISVKRVPVSDRKDVERAVEAARDEAATVVESYAFDIKVIDKNGNELQPPPTAIVEVIFSLERAEDTNLEATVYHIEDGEATALETCVENKEVKAVTDGFSYYQVEFTYGELQYILPGDASIDLFSILEIIGLEGEVENAVSSDPNLFTVEKNDEGEWIVTAKAAFNTNETLTITLNGIEYIITVTDADIYAAGSWGQFLFRNQSWFSTGRGIDTVWGSRVGAFQCITLHTINGAAMYCVNPTKAAGDYYSYTGNGYPMNSCSAAVQDLIARALYWGYPNYYDGTYGGSESMAATQCMIFDIVCGFVTQSAAGGTATRVYKNNTWGFDDPDICFAANHAISLEYNRLLARMNQAIPNVGVPSWSTNYGSAHNVLTLTYNSATGRYEGSWNDTTTNYQYYNFTGTPVAGVTITQTNGNLTITATHAAVEAAGLASPQGYLLQNANTPNRTISTARMTLYHAVTSATNANINWNGQQFIIYNKAAGDETYRRAWLVVQANIVPTGTRFSITKTSGNTTYTSGNANYTLAGAVYGVYSNAACTSELERITTDASGKATTANAYTAGTYYVKEITPSSGYLLDTSTHTLVLAADGTVTGDTTFVETPITSSLSINKNSANTGITDGNSCYSLAGAQYGVYASQADANAGTNQLEVLTTDASGAATSANEYAIGIYYLKELVASPGYLLDPAVHAVTIAADGSISGNSFTEEPGQDPNFIQIRKITSAGATVATITSGYAVFKVEFYANDSWSGSPIRTWYYKTINGICYIEDEGYLDNSYVNSPRFTDGGGDVVIPIGTLKISEETPPAGYISTDQVWTARVYQETSGGDATWHWISAENGTIGYEAAGATVENEHRNGTIEVTKKDSQGRVLAGVTYLLEYSRDGGTTWAPTYKIAADALTDYGACKSQDLVDGTLTTGTTGKVTFEGLMADRDIQYRLTEISAPNGYSLLSSPVYIGTLPVEINEVGVADTEEIEGRTYCYTILFDVTDHSQFKMPAAGGHGFWQIPLSFIISAAGIIFVLRKKNKKA